MTGLPKSTFFQPPAFVFNRFKLGIQPFTEYFTLLNKNANLKVILKKNYSLRCFHRIPGRLTLEEQIKFGKGDSWLNSDIKNSSSWLQCMGSKLWQGESWGWVQRVGQKDGFSQTNLDSTWGWASSMNSPSPGSSSGNGDPPPLRSWGHYNHAMTKCRWHTEPWGWSWIKALPLLPLLHLQAAEFRRQSLRLAAHQDRGRGCESQSFLRMLKQFKVGTAHWESNLAICRESHTHKYSYPLNQKFHFWELILKK